MDKKEFQNLFKIYMKEKGFRIKGQCAYQFVDDQYIIGIHLDHHHIRKVILLNIVRFTIQMLYSVKKFYWGNVILEDFFYSQQILMTI